VSDVPPTAESNADQLSAWNGSLGDFWTRRARRIDDGVAEYHGQLLDAAAIQPEDTVLDIGCGSGQTTRDAARLAHAGSALGIDLSESQLGLARRLAADERVSNVSFEHADAQVHPFPEAGFDVALSRHGVMFFGDPHAAFANIARAVRPGGRLALLTWQPRERNEWLRTFVGILTAEKPPPPPPPPGTPSPLSLSDPDHVHALLSSAGFGEVRVRGLTERMYFGADTDDAYRFVSAQHAGMVAGLDQDARTRTLDALRANLAEHETDDGVYYGSAAWLVDAVRR
jgi:SAM-dependent methyltransferase